MNSPEKTGYLEIFIDGASKGNPGPSGIGVVICRDGSRLKTISSYIGRSTNNLAEYAAFICALREAARLGARVLKVNTDSELLYRQIKRVYKVRNPNILSLYNQALDLMSSFKEVIITHIPREHNSSADKLATTAIKQALKHTPVAAAFFDRQAEGSRSF